MRETGKYWQTQRVVVSWEVHWPGEDRMGMRQEEGVGTGTFGARREEVSGASTKLRR
jgi:hypothetical protein